MRGGLIEQRRAGTLPNGRRPQFAVRPNLDGENHHAFLTKAAGYRRIAAHFSQFDDQSCVPMLLGFGPTSAGRRSLLLGRPISRRLGRIPLRRGGRPSPLLRGFGRRRRCGQGKVRYRARRAPAMGRAEGRLIAAGVGWRCKGAGLPVAAGAERGGDVGGRQSSPAGPSRGGRKRGVLYHHFPGGTGWSWRSPPSGGSRGLANVTCDRVQTAHDDPRASRPSARTTMDVSRGRSGQAATNTDRPVVEVDARVAG